MCGFILNERKWKCIPIVIRSFYKKIINILAYGSKERTEICKILNVEPNGRISEYLHELQLAGFIKRDYTWSILSGTDSKLSKYRLSDIAKHT